MSTGIVSRLLWMGLIVLPAGTACSLALDYPADGEEASFETCTDGVDNDFDSLTDCEEVACSCNACGESGTRPLVPRDTDEMGSFCQQSCECRRFVLAEGVSATANAQVCNLSAVVRGAAVGRCLSVNAVDSDGEVGVEEGQFSVSFVLEQDADGNVALEGALQNVLGRAQFNGQTFELSRAQWQGRSLEFRNLAEGLVLEILLEQRSPSQGDVRLQVTDRVGAVKGAGLRAQLGPTLDAGSAGVNQLAIVESSTLAITPGPEGASPATVRGRWSGRLRAPAGIDRARGGACEVGIFHPDGLRCFRSESLADSLFLMGCVLDGSAPAGSGLLAFRWPAPFSSVFDAQAESGECVARLSGEVLELRARNSILQTVRFALRAYLPSRRVSPSTSLTVATSTESGSAVVEFYRLRGEEMSQPLFELNLNRRPPDARLRRGKVTVEQVRYGAPPRFFGWIEGLLDD